MQKPIKIPEDYRIINNKNSLIIGNSQYGNIGIKTEKIETQENKLIFSNLRMLIIGQSNCGKTELCKNIIKQIWDNINLIPIIIDCKGEYKELNNLNSFDCSFRIIKFQLSTEGKLIVTSDFNDSNMISIQDILSKNIEKRIPLIFDVSDVDLELQQKIGIDILSFFIESRYIEPIVLICDNISTLQYKTTYVRPCIGKDFVNKLKLFMSMARMRGHSCIFIEQRLNYANMNSEILSAFNSFLIGKITNNFDLKRINLIDRNIDIQKIKNLDFEFCTSSCDNIFDHDKKYPIIFNIGLNEEQYKNLTMDQMEKYIPCSRMRYLLG